MTKIKEIWKEVPGEYLFKYEASNLGNIRNAETGRVLKPTINNIGYLKVQLLLSRDEIGNIKNKCESVHRLVALAHLPNPENKGTVNHKDRDKQNNRLDNLEWMTRSENVLHSYQTGRMAIRGSQRINAKLNESQVSEIKALIRQGANLTELAKAYNVSQVTMSYIKTGKSWRHVD